MKGIMLTALVFMLYNIVLPSTIVADENTATTSYLSVVNNSRYTQLVIPCFQDMYGIYTSGSNTVLSLPSIPEVIQGPFAITMDASITNRDKVYLKRVSSSISSNIQCSDSNPHIITFEAAWRPGEQLFLIIPDTPDISSSSSSSSSLSSTSSSSSHSSPASSSSQSSIVQSSQSSSIVSNTSLSSSQVREIAQPIRPASQSSASSFLQTGKSSQDTSVVSDAASSSISPIFYSFTERQTYANAKAVTPLAQTLKKEKIAEEPGTYKPFLVYAIIGSVFFVSTISIHMFARSIEQKKYISKK